jgi:hypothetical protein
MKKEETPAVDTAAETPEQTVKEYRFKHTYIGTMGAFYQGKSYPLTEGQRRKLKEDIE